MQNRKRQRRRAAVWEVLPGRQQQRIRQLQREELARIAEEQRLELENEQLQNEAKNLPSETSFFLIDFRKTSPPAAQPFTLPPGPPGDQKKFWEVSGILIRFSQSFLTRM